MAVTISLEDKISAIAALIENAIASSHECKDKGNCDFDIAVFDRIAWRVLKTDLDNLGKTYGTINWCENAEKVFNG